MLCSMEIEGYLRESDHGAREGVQDKWLLAPLGHRGDMFETAEERSKNGIGGIGRLMRIRHNGQGGVDCRRRHLHLPCPFYCGVVIFMVIGMLTHKETNP